MQVMINFIDQEDYIYRKIQKIIVDDKEYNFSDLRTDIKVPAGLSLNMQIEINFVKEKI